MLFSYSISHWGDEEGDDALMCRFDRARETALLIPFLLSHEARFMMISVDAIHTALGLTFTAVWVLVGQVLVASR